MSYPESLDHMLAAWNEADPTLVRGHLERALAPDAHFVDPSHDIRGIDGDCGVGTCLDEWVEGAGEAAAEQPYSLDDTFAIFP